jgi:hypothetical protein
MEARLIYHVLLCLNTLHISVFYWLLSVAVHAQPYLLFCIFCRQLSPLGVIGVGAILEIVTHYRQHLDNLLLPGHLCGCWEVKCKKKNTMLYAAEHLRSLILAVILFTVYREAL